MHQVCVARTVSRMACRHVLRSTRSCSPSARPSRARSTPAKLSARSHAHTEQHTHAPQPSNIFSSCLHALATVTSKRSAHAYDSLACPPLVGLSLGVRVANRTVQGKVPWTSACVRFPQLGLHALPQGRVHGRSPDDAGGHCRMAWSRPLTNAYTLCPCHILEICTLSQHASLSTCLSLSPCSLRPVLFVALLTRMYIPPLCALAGFECTSESARQRAVTAHLSYLPSVFAAAFGTCTRALLSAR
jgi:hypothetical protein